MQTIPSCSTCFLQKFYIIFLFIFCQRIKLFHAESYLHVYIQYLGRVFEECRKLYQNFFHISYEFIIIAYVCTCKCKSLVYTMIIKHFRGNACFCLGCYTILFANHDWRSIRDKCRLVWYLKFLSYTWDYSDDVGWRTWTINKNCLRFLFVIMVIFNKWNKLTNVRYICFYIWYIWMLDITSSVNNL